MIRAGVILLATLVLAGCVFRPPKPDLAKAERYAFSGTMTASSEAGAFAGDVIVYRDGAVLSFEIFAMGSMVMKVEARPDGMTLFTGDGETSDMDAIGRIVPVQPRTLVRLMDELAAGTRQFDPVDGAAIAVTDVKGALDVKLEHPTGGTVTMRLNREK